MRRILLVTAFLAFSPAVHAGLLPVAVSSQATSEGTQFSYTVQLTSDSKLKTGDFFTLYDFAGYIAASAKAPAGFSVATYSWGITPPGIAPYDNGKYPNLTWTYTGTTDINGATSIGTFSALSSMSGVTQGTFAAQTTRIIDNQPDANITTTEVPVPCAPAVPEPTTMALAALGLPILGGARWLRKRSA